MSFLFPLTLFLGLLAGGIVALYLHRPRRRRQDVSTLLFWQKVFAKEPQRRFLGKLRNPLSLLLQLLIFLLLLLALARPEWGRVLGKQSSIVVLDTRARMQAGNTFQRAKDAVANLVLQASPDHEIALLAADASPRILSPFSSHSRDLLDQLRAVTPSDAGGRLTDSLVLADRLLEGRPGERRILVVSDRDLPDSPGLSLSPEPLLVGEAADNIALLALAHRPLPASPQSKEIFARLGNFSDSDQELEIELELDGHIFDLKKIFLPAGEEQNFSTLVPGEILQGGGQGLLTARLTGGDALASDDSARAALSTTQGLRVLLITDGNPFLEGALHADPGVALEILGPELWRRGLDEGFDAVVFDDVLPDTLAEGLPKNAFFFGRSPFAQEGTEPASVELMTVDPQSPLLWNVDVGTLRLQQARPLLAPPGWRTRTPLASSEGPLLMSLERPDGSRLVATGFRVEASPFPLRVGFPLFISNVVHWLANREEPDAIPFVAGRVYVPEGGEEVGRAPRETGKPAEFSPNPVPLLRNGFYPVKTTGDPSSTRWVAVNTASAEEADLRANRSNSPPLFLPRLGITLAPWQWLTLAALVAILAEWFLHHRRVTE